MARPRKDAPPNPGFLKQWDQFDDPIVNTHAPRWPQTCARLVAYFVKIFGGHPDDYVVSIFTDKDLPGRRDLGYHAFSKGDFPRIERSGKP